MIEIRGGILGRRWAPEILVKLAGKPLRFNRLLDGIEGISDRVLTARLIELEATGMVVRQVDTGPPVRVSYELTEVAVPFIAPLAEIQRLERLTSPQEAAVG